MSSVVAHIASSASVTSSSSPVALTLELEGHNVSSDPHGTTSDHPNDESYATSEQTTACPSVHLEKLQAQDGSLVFVVSMPRLVEKQHANMAADLLMDAMDALPYSVAIRGVKLSDLTLTSEGVEGINMLLSIYAGTVHHLHIDNLTTSKDVDEDLATNSDDEDIQANPDAFASLAEAFVDSKKIISLHLSNTVISTNFWKEWAASHKQLQQLILDQVHVSEESLLEFCKVCPFAATLEDLHVVLRNTMTSASLDAVNSIIASCLRLSSLRWVNKKVSAASKLPWEGIMQVAKSTFLHNRTGALAHVVLEGCNGLTDDEISENGLTGALANLPKLQTLKLRTLGLRDEDIQNVVSALRLSRPPLEYFDFSNNDIGSPGVHFVAELTAVQKIVKNLRILALNNNNIDEEGAAFLFSSFSGCSSRGLHLKLDDNPFDAVQMAFELAASNYRIESDHEILVKERDSVKADSKEAQHNLRHLVAAQTAMAAEFQTLQAQVKEVQQERDALLQAFRSVGVSSNLAGYKQLEDRIERLENQIRISGTGSTKGERKIAEDTYNIGDRQDPQKMNMPYIQHQGTQGMLNFAGPLGIKKPRSGIQRSTSLDPTVAPKSLTIRPTSRAAVASRVLEKHGDKERETTNQKTEVRPSSAHRRALQNIASMKASRERNANATEADTHT